MRRNLYNMIEDEDRMKAEKRNQREYLMRTSTFNAKSIMPQVKSLVADKQFIASENRAQSVIGDRTFSTKGGRRTKRQKKRSGKRSGKRINKRMSRRS